MINHHIGFFEYSLSILSLPTSQRLIGAAALLCEVLALINKSDGRLRALQGASAILWGLVSLVIGAWTSLAICLISVVRNICAGWIQEKGETVQRASAAAIITAIICLTFATWQGFVSLMPAVAAIVSTSAVVLTRGLMTRVLLTLTSFIWIANGLAWNVPEGAIAGVISALAGFYGIFSMSSLNLKIKQQTIAKT